MKSMNRNVKSIVAERERIIEEMRIERKLEVFPSEANFVMFRPRNGISEKLHHRLMQKGYVLRNLSDASTIHGCLRVTVNTPKVNDSFLRVLSQELRTLKLVSAIELQKRNHSYHHE